MHYGVDWRQMTGKRMICEAPMQNVSIPANLWAYNVMLQTVI